MKKIGCLIGLFLTCTVLSFASEEDSLFQAGLKMYNQKDYVKAYHLFDGLVREGYHSADLYFNYGNVCMQQNLPAKAIAYYEKAIKLRPNDSQIQNNLDFANKEVGVDEVTKPSFWARIGVTYLYTLTIISLWIFIAAILLTFFLMPAGKRKIGYLSMFIFGIGTFYFMFQSIQIYIGNKSKYAIAQSELLVYQQPSLLSSDVYDVFGGQKVKVLHVKEGWIQIKTEKDKIGWVQAGKMIVI